MNNNCVEVDELVLEIADYKNDCADMAAEKLFKKCSSLICPLSDCFPHALILTLVKYEQLFSEYF
jgi:hypothetical protein